MVDISVFAQMMVGGLSRAMLYFMIASGFSLIFGLEEIVNFAHGSLFMIGSFLGYEVLAHLGVGVFALPLGLVLGAVVAAAIGTFMEVGLLRKKFGEELEIILVTIGVMYIIHYSFQAFYGTVDMQMVRPSFLEGPLYIGSVLIAYKYKFFVIGLGLSVAVILKYFLDNTNLGLIVRAGIDDADMASALGANIERTFTIVFAIGCALAGLAGASVVGMTAVNVNIGLNYLFFAFAIVVIGGRGSFKGTFYAALIAGISYSAIEWFSPWPLQEASLFILMAIVLLLKPEGIGRAL